MTLYIATASSHVYVCISFQQPAGCVILFFSYILACAQMIVLQYEASMSQSTIKMVVKVEISADVYLVCLVQALSTEKEEVMGLLIGEVRFRPSTKVMQTVHFA